jgi:hypothetical protein
LKGRPPESTPDEGGACEASPLTPIRTKNTVRPSDAADRQFLQVLIDEAAR